MGRIVVVHSYELQKYAAYNNLTVSELIFMKFTLASSTRICQHCEHYLPKMYQTSCPVK